MKKILCLIDGLGSGGAQRQIVGLANLLKNIGYDVSIACYHQVYFYEEWIISHQIPLIKLHPNPDRLSKYLSIRNLQKKERFDVIIAYLDGPTVISCLLKCLQGGFKLLVSERNVTQNLCLSEKLKFLVYRFADNIIPNSYSQQDFIQKHYPHLSHKVTTITNFVDTDIFKPAEEDSSKQTDNVKILVVGRRNPQKNIIGFLRALKKVKDNQLPLSVKWIGDIDLAHNSYNETCLQLVEKWGLADIIHFYSATPHILSEYQQCDAFCLPSLFEGFPNVICEAMSCGKPIICSNICDNPYIVKDESNGYLFDPLSDEDIYLALKRFCQKDFKCRQKMGENSRNMAIDLFSQNRFIKKYVQLIEGTV